MNWTKSRDEHLEEFQLRNTEDDFLVATIFFKNGKFDRVMFGFNGIYSREEWKILASIEKQITKIERKYK